MFKYLNLIAVISLFFYQSCHPHSEVNSNGENPKVMNYLPPIIPDSNYMKLNDIALKYLGHKNRDGSIRIWYWIHSDIDSGGNYKVNLFEYGINSKSDSLAVLYKFSTLDKLSYAMFSVFEIEGRPVLDNYWEVKSISTKYVKPKCGWVKFNQTYNNQKLDKIYLISDKRQSGSPTGSVSHLSLEYIFSDRIEVLDFTAQHGIFESDFPKDKSFVNLMNLVNNEFDLQISPYY